jgi:hypothetical protein
MRNYYGAIYFKNSSNKKKIKKSFYLSNLLLPLLSSQCATHLNPIKMIYLFILLALVFQIALNNRVQRNGNINF